jgi:hypothetical protein
VLGRLLLRFLIDRVRRRCLTSGLALALALSRSTEM